MLKRILIFVILIMFAKPVYDLAMDYMEPTNITVDEATLPVTTGQITMDAEITTTQPAQSARLPEKVTSMEEMADAFYYYFSHFETNFTIEYQGSTADIKQILSRATEEATKRDTYIAGHLGNREIEYEYRRMDATIQVKQDYLTNVEQEKVVNSIVESLISTVKPEEMTIS